MQSLRSDDQFAQIFALQEHAAYVQPAEYTLATDICTIGRSPTCQIVITQSVVSRLHAKIERNGPRYVLSDAGSVNGTFINGQRIREPHLLKGDDRIGLGAVTAVLRFFDPDPTAPSTNLLRYDERAMVFYLGEKDLDLSPPQFRLLSLLYQHAGEVCTHESCAAAIWGPQYDPDQFAMLDQAINRLRSKFRQAVPSADLIKNHRGLGFELAL
jgi:DNA-binding response OmpR family regulator